MSNRIISLLVTTSIILCGFIFMFPQIALGAISDPNNSITINAGSSYEFDNSGISPETLSTTANKFEGKFFDYAIYTSAGSAMSQGINNTTTSLTVPLGGKAIITVPFASKPVIFSGMDGKVSSSTALSREDLKVGESAEFINTSKGQQTLLMTGSNSNFSDYFDYAVYAQTGTAVAQETNSTVTSIIVPAGGKVDVTVSPGSSSVSFGGYQAFFTGGACDNPALSREDLKVGESAEFINTSNIQQTLIRTNSLNWRCFDYTVYMANGAPVSEGLNSTATFITVPAGGKVDVTVPPGSSPVSFGGYNGFFTGKKCNSPALSREDLKVGESAEFVNTDTFQQTLLVNGSFVRYDYAVYANDGSAVVQGINSNAASITVPAGGKVDVTISVGSSPVSFGGYNALFTADKSNHPALSREDLLLGESTEFVNMSNNQQTLLTTGDGYGFSGRFDYAVYAQDGTAFAQGIASGVKSITVPAGGKVDLTVSSMTNGPVSFGCYNTFFRAEKSNKPALSREELKSGESAEVVNTSNTQQTLLTTGDGYGFSGSFDYAVYAQDGTAVAQGIASGVKSINVPAGGKVDVTVSTGSSPVSFGGYHTFFSAEKSKNPALSREDLKIGQRAEFVNTSNTQQTLLTTGDGYGFSGSFDYTVYSKDGIDVTHETSCGVTTIDIPSGGKADVTVVTGSVVRFGGYNAFFESQLTYLGDNITTYTLMPGNNVTFTNNTTDSFSVYEYMGPTGGKLDYVYYNSDGTEYDDGGKYQHGTWTVNLSLDLPGAKRIVLTNNGTNPITLSGPNGLFTPSNFAQPALTYYTITPAGNAVFTNSSMGPFWFNGNMGTAGSKLDYAYYNSDRTEYVNQGNYLNGTWSDNLSTTLPEATRIVVTNQGNNPIILTGPSELFTPVNSDSPALTTYTIAAGNNMTFTNASAGAFGFDVMGTADGGNLDYAYYNSNGTEYDNYGNYRHGTWNHIQAMDIPGSVRIVLTNNGSNPITLSGPNELFTPIASDEPALRSYIMPTGKNATFTNNSPGTYWFDLNMGATGGNLDYVSYNTDGSEYDAYGLYRHGKWTENLCFGIPESIRTVVTNPGSTPITLSGPSELFSPFNSTQPALKYFTLESGKAIAFSNNSAAAFWVDANMGETGGKLDYTYFNSDGTEYNNGGNYQNGEWNHDFTFDLPSNIRLVLNNQGGNSIILSGPDGLFLPVMNDFATLSVSAPSTTGFTVMLNPSLPGLKPSNFILFDSSSNSVSIENATTSDNGATYAISAVLSAGQTYTATATYTGYTFGPAQSFIVPANSIETVTGIAPIGDITVANGTNLANIGLPNTVQAALNDGSTQDVNVTWDGGTPSYDPTTAGIYTFTGTLTMPTGVINPNNIMAIGRVIVDHAPQVTLQSIAVTKPATKLMYTVGDTLDLTGLEVTGSYSDGSTAPESINTANVTGFNSSVPVADQVLTITVSDKTTTYKVQIVAAPITPDNYTVSIGTTTGGAITANVISATSGTAISLTITPDAGMQLKAGSLKYNDETQEFVINGTSFIMPAANIIVTAEFESVPANNYIISIGTLTGGSITANLASATSGTAISLTITPDAGRQLKPGTLKYNDGTQDHIINGTGFIMPTANITITAEFEQITTGISTDYTATPIVQAGINPADGESVGIFVGLKDIKDAQGNALPEDKLAGYQIDLVYDHNHTKVLDVVDEANLGQFTLNNGSNTDSTSVADVSYQGTGDFARLFFVPLALLGNSNATNLTVRFTSLSDTELNHINVSDVTLPLQRGKILNEVNNRPISVVDAVAGLKYLAKTLDSGAELGKVNLINMASILPPESGTTSLKPSVKDIIALMQKLVGLRDDSYQLVSQ